MPLLAGLRPSPPVTLAVDFSSLSPANRCPSSTPIPSVMQKRYQIFTEIFRIVRVLDHMFDVTMPSLYVCIPSKVLHMRH
jgi:hypothetical protein